MSKRHSKNGSILLNDVNIRFQGGKIPPKSSLSARKERRTWGVCNPCSRIEEPKKGKGSYNRRKLKSDLRKVSY